jgi:hypothetical protein
VFVIARFDPRQLGVGHGDHWITGEALAISTLAVGRITAGAKALAASATAAGRQGPRLHRTLLRRFWYCA